MDFEPIEAPTKKDLFVERIASMIISGNLKAGEKLPTERELSENMRISKTAVHSGLDDLSRMGFVEIVPRKGTFVIDYSVNGNLETLGVLLSYGGGVLDRDMMISMLEFRIVLEGGAFEKFAAARTDDDLMHLEEIVQELKDRKNELKNNAGAAADIIYLFHHYICCRSGNIIYALVMNAFKKITRIFWETEIKKFGYDKVIDYLDGFVGCMQRRDAAAASELLKRGCQIYIGMI